MCPSRPSLTCNDVVKDLCRPLPSVTRAPYPAASPRVEGIRVDKEAQDEVCIEVGTFFRFLQQHVCWSGCEAAHASATPPPVLCRCTKQDAIPLGQRTGILL